MNKLLYIASVVSVLALSIIAPALAQINGGGGASATRPTDIKEVRQYLDSLTALGEFSGLVQIAKDSTILFQQGYGFASKSLQVPNSADIKFNLGSINKIITMIAVLQLVENNQLSMDDSLGKYLDIFPSEIGAKVRISQLLNMTSGWGDYWDNDYFKAHRGELRTVSDYMAFIKDMPLDFEPGTDFQHSNTGYEVAGAVIEKITGMDYYDYVREHIYRPAGMMNTDSYNSDSAVANLAIGYTNENPFDTNAAGYCWTNAKIMPPRGTPAGGGYATGPDLLKFTQALLGNKLLSPAYTRFFFNACTGTPGDPILPMLYKGVWRTVGGAQGLSAVLGIDLSSGYTFVVLSNYDFPVAMDVFQAIYSVRP